MAATWRGNTYLLVSFPVGLATSIFLFTMYSVGVALAIIWIGVPIIAATLYAQRWMARFERRRAAITLREPIPTSYLQPHRPGMLGWIHTALGDSATWKDMLWLILLLPVLGLAGFVLAVVHLEHRAGAALPAGLVLGGRHHGRRGRRRQRRTGSTRRGSASRSGS